MRDSGFIWCPEGLDEADAHLLGGDLAGRRVLEIGCGGAQCARWLATVGAHPVGVDLSAAQLRHARRIDAATGTDIGLLQADAQRLPIAGASFDLACSAFGALPFVADSARVLREVFRVLRPGGRFVFSVSHPMRWALPDDPGPGGLTITSSYFDRTPYVEADDEERATYVEHHDARRAGARDRRRRLSIDRPDRTRMAGRARTGMGRLVTATRQANPGHRDFRLRQGPGRRPARQARGRSRLACVVMRDLLQPRGPKPRGSRRST